MGGGLMQLVAYGAQDIYLTGNPQITFFKVVYRRHTNFSMESIKQTFDGTADFGGDVTCTISRNGDLVHRMYLEHSATFTHNTKHANNNLNLVERYGDSLIKKCEIEIGGQMIDRHTSMWNRVYSDLTEFNPSGHFGASDKPNGDSTITGTGTLSQLMTGNGFGLNSGKFQNNLNEFGRTPDISTVNGFTYTKGVTGTTNGSIAVNKIFIPLNFWFCRNPGLALPLIALQYHEVKLKMTFEESSNLARESHDGHSAPTPYHLEALPITGANTTVSPANFDLWIDYIYLDTDERRRFAQVSHEYLIDQVQIKTTIISQATEKLKLNFNHPVKELIWTMRNETDGGDDKGGRHQTPALNKGDSSSGPTSIDTMGGKWRLILNGHDRFKARDTKYFTRTQVWEHHTGYGGVPSVGYFDTHGANVPEGEISVSNDSIGVYSFALKPEEHQPSGTCNFSRIDSAELIGTDLTVTRGPGVPKSQLVRSLGHEDATNVKLTIFAVNYNVLRIMSGMGGLAYSN